MARKPRQQSESGFYHIFARGSGRQLIFEDDNDRRRFIGIMESSIESSSSSLFAYCLMGNHYHMVVKTDFAELSDMVRAINQRYALGFNKRHGREGHLFQSRFGSEAIESDSHFLSAVRYVHRNPIEARIAPTCNYPWSSYRQYLTSSGIINTDMAIDLLGGLSAFAEFHDHPGKESFIDDFKPSLRKPDDEILSIARMALGNLEPGDVKGLGKAERNGCLQILRTGGLSLSEIALITGVSRTTISRVTNG